MGSVYDDRDSAINKRQLDERLKKKIEQQETRRLLLGKIDPDELLSIMTNTIFSGTKEKIKATQRIHGRLAAVDEFLDEVPRFLGWGFDFLDALYFTEQERVVSHLDPEYRPPT